MNLDWSILHWIHDTMSCPLLDLLMPGITALGNGGAVWLAAAGGLLCTKNIADRDFSCWAVWPRAY